MRALRIATSLLAVLVLVGGGTTLVVASPGDPGHSIGAVAGMLDVHRLPGGTFDVDDRVFQYRDYPMAGDGHYLSDPRLSGSVVADWNWDVQASGDQPVPAWGSITIEAAEGSWQGQFSGIRQSDFQPVAVRALLFGDGAYEGLCATLDITTVGLADTGTWVVDGVVHPVATMS